MSGTPFSPAFNPQFGAAPLVYEGGLQPPRSDFNAGEISLVYDNAVGHGDFGVGIGDLATGTALETAILISLFSERRDGSNGRGWWGDTFEDKPLGSRLYLLRRAKITNRGAFLATARTYVQEALEWLVGDRVAASVDVTTSFLAETRLGIGVVVTQPRPTPATYRYQWAWAF